jgi:hypothetical protein
MQTRPIVTPQAAVADATITNLLVEWHARTAAGARA